VSFFYYILEEKRGERKRRGGASIRGYPPNFAFKLAAVGGYGKITLPVPLSCGQHGP
jgi:hypothetical protein